MNLSLLMGWDGGWFGCVIAALFAGLIIGFFLTRFLFKRQMEKNPPINENMIRAMFMQMGRKPSEAQIRAVMNSMKKNNNM